MSTIETVTLTQVDKVLSLQSVDVFRHATTEMLAYIALITTELQVNANKVVFAEDEVADSMYVVVRGRIKLTKEGNEVLQVSAGQSFGTWALFDNQPRLMTATALEETQLLKIKKDDFYDLLADYDEITPVIFRALIERVKTLMPE